MLNEVRTFLARLAEADGAWQREKAWAAGGRLVPVLLGLAAAAFALDAFLQLTSDARLICLALGALALAGSAFVIRWIGWHRRNPPERVARHLEQRDPTLGSRLINALQLADQAGDASLAELTRRLAAGAVQDYTTNLSRVDLPALARTGAARRQGRRAAWAGGVFALLLAAFYPVTSMVVPRFLDPRGDHPPYAFTRVELTDPGATGADVTYGGKLPVKARWSGHEPRELFLTLRPAGRTNDHDAITLPMIRDGDRGFTQEIPDVHEDLLLVAHARNRSFFSHQRTARVILTPRIEKGFLRIAPPAYTGLEAEEHPFTFASASALEGSQLRFRLRSNRPLRDGVAEVIRADDQTNQFTLTLVASNEVAGAFDLAASSRVRFRVTDIAGLVSEPTTQALVSATHDLPPTVHLLEPAQDGFVAQDYALNFRVEASDDFGIRTLRLHQGINGRFPEPKSVTVEGIRRDAGTREPVNLTALGVRPGDRLSFFAEAIDTCPQPHLARTPTVTLTVVSTEEYNDFLREERDVRDLAAKYEELLRKFHELRDEQTRLAEAAADAAKKAAAGDTNALRPDAFDALMARQNELNQRLEQQARTMEQFVRPNPLYDFEKDLQRRLAEETARIRESTATNNAALKQLAEATSRAGGPRSVRPGDLDRLQREAREQAERLGARDEELAKSVSRPLEDLSRLHDLVNDFNAFEQLHQAQRQLAEQTAAYEKRGPLNREDQLALKELASREQAVREALDLLPGLLREHARNAEKEFPKAAASGRKLAGTLERANLARLAGQATDRMLDADGERSAQLARRLEQEMESLFSECKGGRPGESGDELDQYLKLTLGGAQQQSLSQMQQCRKLGLSPSLFPRFGRGRGQGSGSGYSQQTSPEVAVLGNEQLTDRGPKESSTRPGAGNASGQPGNAATLAGAGEKGDLLRNLNPADRQSAPINGESSIEAYRAVVDEYFRAISRQP